MLKRTSRRNLILLSIATAALVSAGVQIYRSPDSRNFLGDMSSVVMKPVASWWAPPTEADKQAAELQRRLQETIPRPVRERYPDRPRVAIMDFSVDVDTWIGDRTARQLSDIARAALDTDGEVRWVDRAEIDAVSREFALNLQAGDASSSVEMGAWLGCDLIVTGSFVDTGRSTQRLRIEVIDLLTADRVSEVELPWSANLRQPESLRDADLNTVLASVRDQVNSAHQRLVALRDAPVMTLLFFRNVTQHDRLDYLEHVLPEQLQQHARDETGVRLVRITRPGAGGDEQSLSLMGLTRKDPEAWSRAADYYLWGSFSESLASASQAGGGRVTVPAEEVPTTVTLYLWSGVGEPQLFSRTAPQRDIEAVLDELAAEVWDAGQVPVESQVSPSQRDAVVQLLSKRLGPGALNTAATRGKEQGRAGRNTANTMDRMGMQAAWFFRPDDLKLAELSLPIGVKVQRGRPWIGLRAREAGVDRILHRFGGEALTSMWVRREKETILTGRAALFRGANYSQSSTFGPGRIDLPRDMPPAARAAYAMDIFDRMKALGRLFSEHPPQTRSRSRSLAIDPDDVLLDDLRLTSQQTAELWSAWWPYFRPAWDTSRDTGRRSDFNSRLLARLGAAFSDAGRSAEYDAMFGEPTVPAAVAYLPTPVDAAEMEHLRGWVDQRVADGLLFPGKSDSQTTAAALRNASGARDLVSDSSSRVSDDPQVPAPLRERLRRAQKLSKARFVDRPSGSRAGLREPRHRSDLPVRSGDGVQAIRLNWAVGANRTLQINPPDTRVAYRVVVPWQGRYAALRVDSDLGSVDPQRHTAHTGLGLLDPLTLGTDFLHEKINESKWHDLAVTGTRLWLATADDGLKWMSPWGEDPLGIRPEHGLLSQDIRQLAFDGQRLWLLSGDGRLGVIESPEAAEVDPLDARLPDRFAPHRLEAAGGRAAVLREGDTPGWCWVDTSGIEPIETTGVRQSLESSDVVVDVQGDGDGFWVITTTRLLRVSGGGQVLRDLPLPAPPVDTLRVRGDDDLIWLAYHWDIADKESDVPLIQGRSETLGRTRLVAADATNGRVLNQTQWSGRVADLFVTADELHLFMPDREHDVVMVRRSSLLNNPRDDAGPRPLGVPAGAWAAYRGKPVGDDTPSTDAWPPVLAAVRAGRADTLAQLLDAGHNPNAAVYGYNGHSAAALAVLTDRPDLLDLLHQAGVRLDETHPSFGTLGHAAVLAGSVRCIAWLGKHGVDLDAYAQIARTRTFMISGVLYPYRSAPLHLAVARALPNAVEALLNAGASVREGLHDADRMVPLLMAARNGDAQTLEVLLRHGADPRLARDRRGSVLNDAVTTFEPEVVQRLLDRGAGAADARMLAAAVKRGHTKMVGVLLSAGADAAGIGSEGKPALRHSGDIPLVRAIETRRLDLYRLLLNASDMDLTRSYGGAWRLGDLVASAMMEARFLDEAIDMVAQGFSIDVPDDNGNTLLMTFASRTTPRSSREYLLLAELLLGLGADPAQQNNEGKRAVSLTHHSALRELLQDPAPVVQRLRGGAR